MQLLCREVWLMIVMIKRRVLLRVSNELWCDPANLPTSNEVRNAIHIKVQIAYEWRSVLILKLFIGVKSSLGREWKWGSTCTFTSCCFYSEWAKWNLSHFGLRNFRDVKFGDVSGWSARAGRKCYERMNYARKPINWPSSRWSDVCCN